MSNDKMREDVLRIIWGWANRSQGSYDDLADQIIALTQQPESQESEGLNKLDPRVGNGEKIAHELYAAYKKAFDKFAGPEEFRHACNYDIYHKAGLLGVYVHCNRVSPQPSAQVPEGRADEIVTQLYRRFKDWSKRGFGPDDVTWCEVKANVIELLTAAPSIAEKDQ